jgi:predicted AAA+ superfamily ATPase
MGYSFKNSKGKTYFLHTKDVVLKGGRNQTIYYFAKDERSNSCDLPDGKKIVENEKTGLPFVKSIK